MSPPEHSGHRLGPVIFQKNKELFRICRHPNPSFRNDPVRPVNKKDSPETLPETGTGSVGSPVEDLFCVSKKEG
jgi:hypothetical protein